MAYVVCGRCGIDFSAKQSHIALGFAKFCSRKCSFESMRNGEWVGCNECGKQVYRSLKYIKASKSQKYFCTKSCQTKWRNNEFSGKRHANWQHGRGSYRNIMKRAGAEAVCNLCRMTDERVIVAHHKDQNRKNNRIENLVWLCRNCHYLVHQYAVGREQGLIV